MFAQLIVSDPEAAMQREINFIKSLEETIKTVNNTRGILEAQQKNLEIFEQVNDAFKNLSIMTDSFNKLSKLTNTYSRIKREITENKNLYPEEKTLMLTRLSVLLADAANKSDDLQSIASSLFKTDSGSRYNVAENINNKLGDITKEMNAIFSKAKRISKNRAERKTIDKLVYTGKF
jgi:uncharacterized phage infection (PIP) family protein YhgE